MGGSVVTGLHGAGGSLVQRAPRWGSPWWRAPWWGTPWRQWAVGPAQPPSLAVSTLLCGRSGLWPFWGTGAGTAQIRPLGRLSPAPERLRGECCHLGHRAPWVTQGPTSVITTSERRLGPRLAREPRGARRGLCGGEKEPADGQQPVREWHPGIAFPSGFVKHALSHLPGKSIGRVRAASLSRRHRPVDLSFCIPLCVNSLLHWNDSDRTSIYSRQTQPPAHGSAARQFHLPGSRFSPKTMVAFYFLWSLSWLGG